MNQDLNNLNQNNFNTQGNNGVPNNQSFNNNIDNHSTTQSTGYYQNNIVQDQNLQQSKYQQPMPQTVQTNSSNQNFETKPKKNNTGLIIGIILAAVFIIGICIVAFIIGFVFIFNSKKTNNSSNIFYGNGFELTYNSEWLLGTVSGHDALSYKSENSYLVHIGTSALDQTINCDFELNSCKTSIYNEFYNYWSSSMPSTSSSNNSLNLYKGDSSFKTLNNDTYYVTYNYGFSETELKGKYYLLISKEKNAVLSFMTNTSLNVKEFDNVVLDLLRTIKVDEFENKNDTSDNIIYDDELYNTLNSMSNWNRYSNLRSGKIGNNKNINGGWRILSDSETYWVFRNGEFWWYKSVNDLDDNYWYGTTKIITGKSGLMQLGFDESRINSIISTSNGKVTENNIYTIIMTPLKIISGGIDKSDTNIAENSVWNFVWIIVDHGNEGIEAQVLNMESNNTTFYVKTSD